MPGRQFFQGRDVFEADWQDAGVQVVGGLADPAGHIGDPELGLEGDLPGGDDTQDQLLLRIEEKRADAS